jgi:hypothetical protein
MQKFLIRLLSSQFPTVFGTRTRRFPIRTRRIARIKRGMLDIFGIRRAKLK